MDDTAARAPKIENIDLTGTGNNSLKLTGHDALNLSEASNTLLVVE